MKRKLPASIAVVLVILIAFLIFGNHSFQPAPIALPASPMAAFRITGDEGDSRYFRNDPNTLGGYAIVERREIADPQLQQDVIDLLKSRLVYGNSGARCFEPGIAIQLGTGQNQVDALICLECQHIYFFQGDKVLTRELNSTGLSRIKEIYTRLFPGHSAEVLDEDTKQIAAARDEERDKRQLAAAKRGATPPSQPEIHP